MKPIYYLFTMIAVTAMSLCSCSKKNTVTPPPATTTPQTVTVTTLAGSGSAGYTNATGTTARFNGVWSVGADAAGNVYVADQSNQVIRQVTAGGVVSTFAGNGAAGFLNATGVAAQFNNPHELALDASGNIYVVDQNNHMIREVSPSGIVTTFAGSGTQGFKDGPAATAEFNFPSGVAVAANGDVYVADFQNNAIRKISGGMVTTLAGGTEGDANGTGTAASFNQPDDVAIDNSGNVFITDWANHEIRKVTAAGVVTTFAGNGTAGLINGTGANTEFNHPWGIAIDSKNNLYIGDEYNNAIRKITSAGVVTTLAGSGNQGLSDGTGASASFNAPLGVSVTADGSIVYVADWQNNVVRKITIK